MRKHVVIFILICAPFLNGCAQISEGENVYQVDAEAQAPVLNLPFDSSINTIHIYVALCDNNYQGIVPVPARIGNGQDPDNNLYWGCGYGIRTYFKRSAEWKLVRSQKVDSLLLERLVFKHLTKNYYLIADAYNGKNIKQCTKDFLNSTAGQLKDTVQLGDISLGIAGNSKLVGYIGHNGLMDFSISETFQNADGKKRDAILLACYSKSYFKEHLVSANANALV